MRVPRRLTVGVIPRLRLSQDSYRRLMWSVRFHGTLFFSALNVRRARQNTRKGSSGSLPCHAPFATRTGVSRPAAHAGAECVRATCCARRFAS